MTCHCCAGVIPTSMGQLCSGRGTQNAGYTNCIGSHRRQNGSFRSVMELCAKVITEIMENRDVFHTIFLVAFFTFSVGRFLFKSLYRIFSFEFSCW